MYRHLRCLGCIPKCHRGFTIVELLVTLAVIGALLALTVPAIQMARESSRRVTCQNRQKQIVLATIHHADVIGSYPAACEAQYGDKGYSWGVALLPFLDQSVVFEKLRSRGTPNVHRVYFEETGSRLPYIDTRLSVFRCPSAITEDAASHVGPLELLSGYEGAAVSNYAGCVYGWSRGIMWGSAYPGHRFYPRDVVDGLSNTLAYGERSQPSEGGRVWNTWAICNAGSSGFQAIGRMYTGGNPIHNATYRSIITDRAFSWHPAICNFAFCDGSVRSISESIDTSLYQALGGMNDGKIGVLP